MVFGCFSLLVLSDFGGPRQARALAYIAASLAGALLVALGTLLSASVLLATMAMVILGLVLTFVGRIFGGYVAAAQTGLLLSFVVALSIPASASAIPARLTGWAIAGTVSTLAAMLLWPRFGETTFMHTAAAACRAIATAVETRNASDRADELAERIKTAREDEQRAARQFATSTIRPIAPARRNRAMAQLLSELDTLIEVVEHPLELGQRIDPPRLPESDRLQATVLAALRSTSELLSGGSPPDLEAVEEARLQHRSALDGWAAARLRAGGAPEGVLNGIDADHTLRVLAYLTLALGSNAMIAAGHQPPAVGLLPSVPAGTGLPGVLRRTRRMVAAHLNPTSTVLQASLRVAIGLGIAVALTKTLALAHAFWVVLGALQVLRSNALATGRTTVRALIGNAFGVVIGGVFVILAGNDPVVMWVALPLAIFLAAYATTAIGFAASQAAFTINLIVIFNLISPTGWHIGIVRLEDLAIGVAISLVVGLLLWPWGARREFARSLAAFYRALVPYVTEAFDRVLGMPPPPGAASARAALAARDRAGDAFDTLLNDHGVSPQGPQAGVLLAAGNHVLLAVDMLSTVANQMGYRGERCPGGAAQIRRQVETVVGHFLDLANVLQAAVGRGDASPVAAERIRSAALDCLRRWATDDRVGRSAMAVAVAGEWVLTLSRISHDMQRPVASAAAAARQPWWH